MSGKLSQESEEIGRGSVSAQLREARSRLFEILSRKTIMTLLTVIPALVMFLFLTAVPISWAIAASFNDLPTYQPEWTWVGIENFVWVLQDSRFWEAVERSVVFAGGSVAIQVVFGTALALLINQNIRYKTVIRGIVMLPYLVPTAVLGFIVMWMANSHWGIVNQLLYRAGFIDQFYPWFGEPETAMPALVVSNSWKFSIFVTIMVLARLQGIPEGYFEAARMSGANGYQIFRDIIWPNIQNVILIVLLLRGVWMFNKYDIIDVLTAGGPGDHTTTVAIYAYDLAFASQSLGRAAATSTVLFVLLGVVAAVYFIYFEPEKEVRVE